MSEIAFELVLERPAGFTFKPGQRLRLDHQNILRDYSLSSAPDESHLELCIRYVAQGVLTPQLNAIPVASRMSFSGPHGYFIYRKSSRPSVWVATGTGAAPFASMVRAGIRPDMMLHGAGQSSELYYAAYFQKAAQKYIACLSRSEPPSPEHHAGRVTDYLQRVLPEGVYDFYLCGSQEMIADAIAIVDQRFEGSLVYTEAFY